MLKLPFTLMLAGTLTATLLTATPAHPQTAPTTIAVNSTAARASFDAALTKYESGDLSGAIKELDRAIAIDNKYIDAYLYRGVLVTLGQMDSSSVGEPSLKGKNSIPKAGIADFDRILAIEPNHVRATAYRGYAKIANGDPTGIKDIDRAIAIAPDNLAPYLVKSFVSLGKISRTETKKIFDISRRSDNLLISFFATAIAYERNKDEANRSSDNSKLTTSKAYFDRAIEKIGTLDFKSANIDLDKAIELDPKDAQAYFYRGVLGLPTERERSLIAADFDRASKLAPLDYKLSTIGQLFSGDLEANPIGAMESVAANLDKAIVADPKSADLYPMRALLQRTVLLDRDKAISDLIQTGKIYRNRDNLEMYFVTHSYLASSIKKPIEASEYITLAENYAKADRMPLAMATLDRAIAIDAKYTRTYFTRAAIKFAQKDYRGAVAEIDRGIAIEPSTALYLQRAQVKSEKLNDFPSAAIDYDKAIALAPEDTYPYRQRAEFRAEKLKDFKGALADYNRIIAIQPKEIIGYAGRARLYAEKIKNNRLALADYNRIIKMNPKNIFSRIALAQFKAKNLKDIKGGLADLDRAIALSPNNGLFYITRANFKYEYIKDGGKSALADYNLAIARDPKNAYLYADRATFKSTKLKNDNGVMADFDRAISMKADVGDFYLQRGNFKANQLKDTAAAIADYRQAARLFKREGELDNLDLVADKLKTLGTSVN
jgi:Tfp pilus assembly protein PilF